MKMRIRNYISRSNESNRHLNFMNGNSSTISEQMAKWLPPILPYNNTFHFPLPFVDPSTEGRKTHQSPHGSFLSIDLFLSLLFPRVFPFAKKKALLVWPVLARFRSSSTLTRPGLTFCVPGERPLVAFIAVIIRPLPRGPRPGRSRVIG